MKNNKLKYCLCFCVSLISLIADGSEEYDLKPESVVHKFYSFLLSGKCACEGPEIFVNPDSIAGASALIKIGESLECNRISETTLIWGYLLERKRVFIPKETDIERFFYRFSFGYLFTSFPKNGLFIQGNLSVNVYAGSDAKAGVKIIIQFPVEMIKEDYQLNYKIDLAGVNVNGVYLDLNEDFKRDDCLYTVLGISCKSQ